MADRLDVYLYGELVGTITRGRTSGYHLRYQAEYIARADSVPISVQFPVTAQVYGGAKLEWYLENLLPDRHEVRQQWAIEAGLPSANAFDLLRVYGADVAGALEFYPSGAARGGAGNLNPLTEQDIGDRIRTLRADDSRWKNGAAINQPFSLGGAQGKFALSYRDGAWFEASGAEPSTHIFKPGVAGLDGSDVTEHIVLRLAHEAGLPVARTEMMNFDGERVLVVERFDRRRSEGRLLRVHQEDLAQATGTSTLKKYEREGGPGYLEFFEMFDRNLSVSEALNAKRVFAESLVFAWIIGHNDAHAKNYSLTLLPGATSLAPLYDLSSILVFQLEEVCRAKDYRAFDNVQLAYSIDRHSSGGDTIGAYSAEVLNRLEAEAGLPPHYLGGMAKVIARNLVAAVNEIVDTLPAELKSMRAVKNFPYVAYAQAQRVNDLLGA